MKTKQTAVGWVKAHPLKAIGFGLVFLLSAFFAGKLYDQAISRWLLGLFVLTLVIFSAIWLSDAKKVVAILLAALIGFSHAGAEDRREEPQAQLGCAIAVVVVGGIVVYMVGKWCSKKFPKTPPPATNQPPPFALMADGGDMAASFSDGCESCWIPDGMKDAALFMASFEEPTSGPVTSYEMTATVELGRDGQPQLRITSSAVTAIHEGHDDATASFDEFQAGMRAHGVERIAWQPGEAFFGRNGQPATQADVPIYYNTESWPHTVTVGARRAEGEFVDCVWEKSPDLTHWYHLSNSSLAVGQQYKYIDLSRTGQMFYRLRRADNLTPRTQ